jgi:hypothetical protein
MFLASGRREMICVRTAAHCLLGLVLALLVPKHRLMNRPHSQHTAGFYSLGRSIRGQEFAIVHGRRRRSENGTCHKSTSPQQSFQRAVGLALALLRFHPLIIKSRLGHSCALCIWPNRAQLVFCAIQVHLRLPRLAGWKSRGCSGIARISVIQSQFASSMRES